MKVVVAVLALGASPISEIAAASGSTSFAFFELLFKSLTYLLVWYSYLFFRVASFIIVFFVIVTLLSLSIFLRLFLFINFCW